MGKGEKTSYFGRLASIFEIFFDEGFKKWIAIDHGNEMEFCDRISSSISFIRNHQGHWIEIRVESNGYHYAVHKDVVFIVEPWMLKETRLLNEG